LPRSRSDSSAKSTEIRRPERAREGCRGHAAHAIDIAVACKRTTRTEKHPFGRLQANDTNRKTPVRSPASERHEQKNTRSVACKRTTRTEKHPFGRLLVSSRTARSAGGTLAGCCHVVRSLAFTRDDISRRPAKRSKPGRSPILRSEATKEASYRQ
jgi:hypothetical protein